MASRARQWCEDFSIHCSGIHNSADSDDAWVRRVNRWAGALRSPSLKQARASLSFEFNLNEPKLEVICIDNIVCNTGHTCIRCAGLKLHLTNPDLLVQPQHSCC